MAPFTTLGRFDALIMAYGNFLPNFGPKFKNNVLFRICYFPYDKSMYRRVIIYPTQIHMLKRFKKKILNFGWSSWVLPVIHLLLPVAQLFPN